MPTFEATGRKGGKGDAPAPSPKAAAGGEPAAAQPKRASDERGLHDCIGKQD